MAYLPELMQTQQSVLTTTTFLGYDHRPVIQDGACYDMKNMCGDQYPLLCTRGPRGVWWSNVGKVIAMTIANGSVWWVEPGVAEGTHALFQDGNIIGNYSVPKDKMSGNDVRFVEMGAYLCLWPAKAYVNMNNIADRGVMYNKTTTNGNITISMCRADGTDYDTEEIEISETAPTEPGNGDLWIDTSADPHVLKQYNTATEEWVQVLTTYVKIQADGIGKGFAPYDTVSIVNIHGSAQIQDLNGDKILYDCGDNYLMIAGLVDEAKTVTGSNVIVNRDVPDLDFVIESDNRLWGCLYQNSSGVLNEIYCCKLGDFKNWKSYMGLSTDSFAVTVGTTGPFTGAITYKGTPIFFKENHMHRITGKIPSSFALTTTKCDGIQYGSWQSAQIVNDVLYYKADAAVMVYDGSYPTPMQDVFGGETYVSASAGAIDGKYYLSMEPLYALGRRMFVLDTKTGLWHKQDEDCHAQWFSKYDPIGFGEDRLAYLDTDSKQIRTVTAGSFNPAEDSIDWYAEFGTFGYEYPEQKYLSRFNLRMKLEAGSTVKLEIQYDSDGVWHKQGEMRGTTTRTFMLPVIPRRCDHCKIRISGTGPMTLYTLSRVLEIGGDG